ncbi:mitochondrial inner membrane protease subunit 2-like [Paramacrobiotus metropolitanus]|uniref:mitochondrial inner membrane protease subunit 2-like n=1 Tax=Paramacrobiotus metropolitanus TaxID=2943436 RepID=UPI002445E74A|nr:mitochondrial inner membrane protease subunit 2-like [Paramacrobiotus metropolitanus]
MPSLIWQSLKFVGVAVPVSLTFLDNVGCLARVQGSSMLPTLQGDQTARDYIWLNALAVRNFIVNRGDIVAFTSPSDPSRILIKRVIALEGDTVRTLTYKQSVVEVQQGCMWVEGDNRDLSMDSNTFGAIPRGLLLGVATHIVWPPSRWSRLKQDCRSR